MTDRPIFALAWVTHANQKTTKMGNGGSVLFVNHPKRGWEIPGGHLNDGESPEQALLRELKEETGCTGQIIAWNKDYYPKGWVAHVIVDDEQNHKSWNVEDANVAEVRWWSEIPPLIEWTREEFEDLSEWCCSL